MCFQPETGKFTPEAVFYAHNKLYPYHLVRGMQLTEIHSRLPLFYKTFFHVKMKKTCFRDLEGDSFEVIFLSVCTSFYLYWKISLVWVLWAAVCRTYVFLRSYVLCAFVEKVTSLLNKLCNPLLNVWGPVLLRKHSTRLSVRQMWARRALS